MDGVGTATPIAASLRGLSIPAMAIRPTQRVTSTTPETASTTTTTSAFQTRGLTSTHELVFRRMTPVSSTGGHTGTRLASFPGCSTKSLGTTTNKAVATEQGQRAQV